MALSVTLNVVNMFWLYEMARLDQLNGYCVCSTNVLRITDVRRITYRPTEAVWVRMGQKRTTSFSQLNRVARFLLAHPLTNSSFVQLSDACRIYWNLAKLVVLLTALPEFWNVWRYPHGVIIFSLQTPQKWSPRLYTPSMQIAPKIETISIIQLTLYNLFTKIPIFNNSNIACVPH